MKSLEPPEIEYTWQAFNYSFSNNANILVV